jgi:hypothetical protein
MLSSFYGRIFVMYKPADVTVSFDNIRVERIDNRWFWKIVDSMSRVKSDFPLTISTEGRYPGKNTLQGCE